MCSSRLQEGSAGTNRRTSSGSQQDLPLSTISMKQRSCRNLEEPPPHTEVPPGFQEPEEEPRGASEGTRRFEGELSNKNQKVALESGTSEGDHFLSLA